MNSVKVIAVTGPTATGKTSLAVRLARQFNGEIVSIDSRQVYRHLDIGSGKDLAEYGEVPYHLIDVADPATEVYNLHRFCREAYPVIEQIQQRGHLPVLCGGTPLYLTALLQGYRLPGGEMPLRFDCDDPRRRQNPDAPPSFTPPFELDALTLGVYFPRTTVRERIALRLDARIASGMIEEGQQLHDEFHVDWEKMRFFGLEYRALADLLTGKFSSAGEMRDDLYRKICQFAKRQDIFFRKMEREGILIHWLQEGNPAQAALLIQNFLAGNPLPPPDIRLADIDYGKRA